MYCNKCGSVLPEGCNFCGRCGANQNGDLTLENNTIKAPAKSKKVFYPIIAIAVVIAIVIGIIGLYYGIGIATLSNKLDGEWSRTESSGSSYYSLVLDFDDDEIEYNFESGYSWIDSTIATYEYRVVSPNTIKVKHKGYNTEQTIKIRFSGTMMKMTPAITSTDSYECWFKH